MTFETRIVQSLFESYWNFRIKSKKCLVKNLVHLNFSSPYALIYSIRLEKFSIVQRHNAVKFSRCISGNTRHANNATFELHGEIEVDAVEQSAFRKYEHSMRGNTRQIFKQVNLESIPDNNVERTILYESQL